MKQTLKLLGGVAAAAFGAAVGLGAGASAAPISQTAFVSTAPAAQTVSFQVFLPLRNAAGLDALLAAQQDKASSSYHRWLTPQQFAAQFGPSAASMASVSKALADQGLTVTATHGRSLDVTGTAGAVSRAFATRLQNAQPRRGPMRMVAASPLVLPSALQQEGAVVARFAGLPLHQTHARIVPVASPDNRNGNAGGYYFTDLKQAYGFPSYQATVHGKRLDGTGVNVAIVISNDVLDSDVTAQFDHEKFTAITGKPAPKVNRLLINGGAPFDPEASIEASLDVQMVLGAAPGANVTLVNIPDLSDDNIMAGYEAIVESNAYDIVNSSFGGCELFYTAAYNGGTDFTSILQTYESIFKQGNAQGITFVASSGDSGGLGCTTADYFSGSPTATPSFIAGVESPADSPSVTAVGGTNLITTTPPMPQTTPPQLNSAYVAEQAYGDPELPHDPYGLGLNVTGGYWGAGGGKSVIFKRPAYQLLANTGDARGRTLPDVGMHVGGCPSGISVLPCGPNRSYVIVYLNGRRIGLIGTSVASPEFVGATALFLERIGGRAGNLNDYLYAAGGLQTLTGGLVSGYHRYIPGFDGKYDNTFPNGAQYDYLVGQGTPKVKDLFLMGDLPSAGVPQTPSNP